MAREVFATVLFRVYGQEDDIMDALKRLEILYGSRGVGIKVALREWKERQYGKIQGAEQVPDTGEAR